MNNNLAILILSCDKYESFWPVFIKYFKKYWPHCKYDTYLLSNKKKFTNKFVKNINVYPDLDWSSTLLDALNVLEQYNFKNVLLIMEDCPINNNIDQKEFENIYQDFCFLKMGYLNLKSCPKPPSKIKNKGYIFTKIPKGAIYRTAIMPNLWNIKILKSLLKKGESAWEFEVNGSVRSDKFDNFFTINKPFITFLHTMIKGKLNLRVKKYLKQRDIEDLNIDEMNLLEFYNLRIKEFISLLYMTFIPYRDRRSLRYNIKKYLKV